MDFAAIMLLKQHYRDLAVRRALFVFLVACIIGDRQLPVFLAFFAASLAGNVFGGLPVDATAEQTGAQSSENRPGSCRHVGPSGGRPDF